MTGINANCFTGVFQKKNGLGSFIVNLIRNMMIKTTLFIICFSMAFFPPWLPLSVAPAWAGEQAEINEIILEWLAAEANKPAEFTQQAPLLAAGQIKTAATTSNQDQQSDKKIAWGKNSSSQVNFSDTKKNLPDGEQIYPSLAVSGSADQDADYQRGTYEKTGHSNETHTREARQSQSDQVRNSLISQGTGKAAETIGNWLSNRGQVRLNLNLNNDDRLDWSGDLLLPLWESESSLIFTQIGARSMENNRNIANLGLGQRFFPGEDFMLGYNAFYDYDLKRHHSRVGIGAEIAHDWIRLAANGYWPLSDWKKSKDFTDFNQERPARGWDLRTKAYIPSYRQIALTGDFTQWYGEVSALGGKPVRDPGVFSYGVEYTPFPLLTTYVRQQQSSGSQQNTEFGLTLNWNFGLSAA